MSIRFEVQVRAFEDGQHAYDQKVGFQLPDVAEPIAASRRMVEEFARGYHGLKSPTPADLNNVTCNELFHLLRRAAGATDQRMTLFVSGSLLRLCALPDTAEAFAGLGRHPNDGERLMLTLQRMNTTGGRAQHNASLVSLDAPGLGGPAALGTA
jgi:hypothetical protein